MTTNTNAAPTLHDRVMGVITDVWDRQLQIDEATATVIDLCEASTAAQPPADGALNAEALKNARMPKAQETPPAVVEPFTAAQRARMFRNRPSDVGNGLSLADWHRVVQYVEACHDIKPKEQSND